MTRVVFGCRVIRRLGELASTLGGRRILIVTDAGIVRAGHVARAVAAIADKALESFVFDRVEENPTTRHVDWCVQFARQHGIDLIVGLGGGSSMDTAKGANFLLTNGGKMADYWGVGKAAQPMLPMIAVPTTAGTGSEAQSFALIADERTHQKMACGDRKAACRIALLDPELTVSQPDRVAAACGIDALAHAVETLVTTRRNPISQAFSREAWSLLSDAFPRMLHDGADLVARAKLLLGAHYAGIAIENSMLGAAHAAANPLTAHHRVTHGVAVGLMLPHVVRFNAESCAALYAGLVDKGAESGEALAAKLTELMHAAGLPTTLPNCGVDAPDYALLAEEASRQWTAQFNPRPVDAADFERLYWQAYNGK